MLNKPIFPIKDLGYVTAFIKDSVEKNALTLAPIQEAPLWLRILARGDYCAYKNTIYVPLYHYSLVSSKSNIDRDISTAKLCKWFMAIHDFKHISAFTAVSLLYSNSYILFYFLYEFFFLSACEHPHKDLITLGFMSSRRTWYGKKIKYETILSCLVNLINDPKSPKV